VRGKGGLREYTDDAVNDPAIKRIRESTTATGDPSITEDQAHVEVELKDGRRLSKFVEQSLGNIHRPLTDKQLEEKFRDQAVLVLAADEVETIIQQCWKIDQLDDVGDMVRATVPGGAAVAS
jgi:2-methylcitrate dehydratase PrpD